MKPYLLITSDKFKFEITAEEKAAIVKAINRGDKLLELQDSVISLAITPTIVKSERWFAQENQRLRSNDKRLCKKCGSIMEMSTGCTCWDMYGMESKNPFMLELPEAVKRIVHDGLRVKSFPKLTEEEVYEVAGARYMEEKDEDDSGPLYTIDEDGVKLYS